MVAPDVDGTFRLPKGASLDIVAGPYESTDVVAILRAIDETATDAELERLSRSCRIHVEIPEDAEGEWVLEILVDGEIVTSIPILMTESGVELVEAAATGVLEVLSVAVDHLETGGDGPSLVQIASSDDLPTQVESTNSNSVPTVSDTPEMEETLPSTGFSLVGSTFFGVLWLIAGASLLVARRR